MTESAGRPVAEPRPAPSGWWRGFRGLPRLIRWPAYAAVVALLALLAALVTGVVFVRKPLPQVSGTLTLPGLEGRVTVIRDAHGIPQIYADSLSDLMRAEGYVHAQERFYEMDLRRHVTAGRLSEMFGEATLDTDKLIRTLGWRRTAERELALVEPDTRTALQAYADGVNAYLDSHSPSQVSIAYTLLRVSGLTYTPEPWTPADSLAWLKAMAWDLRGNMDDEANRVLVGVNHTDAQVDQLYPAYPYDSNQPIVTSGAVVDGTFVPGVAAAEPPSATAAAYHPAQVRALAAVDHSLRALPTLLGHGAGVGSNSWAVDGAHSATGAPLLANDPHLGVSLPGIWMQVGLHCRTVGPACPMDVAGFSFSGVPGVIIGHNADIAWGFTNLGPDVADLYLERVGDTTWTYDGKDRPLSIRHETIKVRGEPDFDLRVRETAHGPLLSDVSSDLSSVGANAAKESGDSGYAVSLAWTGSLPTRTADAIMRLDLAKDWADFRGAARDFAVPAQNLLYADRDGHIGYQAPGLIPIRGPGNDGRLPAHGWDPAADWTGRFVPFRALPRVLDPPEGFLVTANQAVIGPDYPYYLTDSWDRGYRSQRIRELLQREGELSVSEMAAIQNDTRNPMAPTLVPYLLQIDDLGSSYFRAGQRLLTDWDYRQPADSAAAAYYNAVWSHLLALTFHDELRESLWPDGGDRWFGVVAGLLRSPTDAWWDDHRTKDVTETRDDILRQAMRDARDELTRREALDPGKWTWGAIHTLDLREQTLGHSGVGGIEWLMNRTGYRLGGGDAIVDATSWDAAEGYQVTWAPSMRMVVSLADFDDSRWVSLTGVSGHPFDPHYVDQTELYAEGKTLAWPFSEGAVRSAGTDTLTLTPGAAATG